MRPKIKVLIYCADPDVSSIHCYILRTKKFDVVEANDAAVAGDLLLKMQFRGVICIRSTSDMCQAAAFSKVAAKGFPPIYSATPTMILDLGRGAFAEVPEKVVVLDRGTKVEEFVEALKRLCAVKTGPKKAEVAA